MHQNICIEFTSFSPINTHHYVHSVGKITHSNNAICSIKVEIPVIVCKSFTWMQWHIHVVSHCQMLLSLLPHFGSFQPDEWWSKYIFFRPGLTPNVDTFLVSNYTYDEKQDLLSSILFHTLLFHFITVLFFFSDGYINHSLCAFVSLSSHPSVSLSLCRSVWFLLIDFSILKGNKMSKMSNACTSEFY